MGRHKDVDKLAGEPIETERAITAAHDVEIAIRAKDRIVRVGQPTRTGCDEKPEPLPGRLMIPKNGVELVVGAIWYQQIAPIAPVKENGIPIAIR